MAKEQNVVFYAPNQALWKRTLKCLRERYSKSERQEKLEKFFERAESYVNSNIINSKSYEAEFYRVYLIIKKHLTKIVLSDKDENFDADNGTLQAVAWCLNTILCDMEREKLEKDGITIKRAYYAGASFGEFWAATYSTYYITWKIILIRLIYFAYLRGEMMQSVVDSQPKGHFSKLIIPIDANSEIRAWEEYFKQYQYGWMVQDGGKDNPDKAYLCIFGTTASLESVHPDPPRKMKMLPSIPFHSKFLREVAEEYGLRSTLPYIAKVSDSFIPVQPIGLLDREIGPIVTRGFYTPFDEREYRLKIKHVLEEVSGESRIIDLF